MEITFVEFSKMLDKQNPFRDQLVSEIGEENIGDNLRFFKKTLDLTDELHEAIALKYYPIVDKRTGTVIAVNGYGLHWYLRNLLYRYHTANTEDYIGIVAEERNADLYIDEGYGYFMPSVEKCFVVSHGYKPDRFDKDVFIFFKTLRI